MQFRQSSPTVELGFYIKSKVNGTFYIKIPDFNFLLWFLLISISWTKHILKGLVPFTFIIQALAKHKTSMRLESIRSVQSLVWLSHQLDMRDDSAEVLLFQSFLGEAIVSSSSMRDVHSMTLSIQHFHCQLQHGNPPRCPEGCVWKAVRMHDILKPWGFPSLDICQKGILLALKDWSYSAPCCWPCSKEMWRSFLKHFGLKSMSVFPSDSK